MGKIIAIANQKGGVGKTTTSINLSAALAERGKRVLIVDLDSQGNATSGVGVDKNILKSTVYELLSFDVTFEECLVHTIYKNLDIIPSNVDMAAAEIELLEEEDRETILKGILDPIKKNYDYIFIDCPPSLNMVTVNAMVAADSVMIPIQCEYYALEGLSQLLETISLITERINSRLEIEGVVFTMFDPRVKLSSQVVETVKNNLAARVFKTLIPRNVRLAEAPSYGMPIIEYAKLSTGARAYKILAKEIVALNSGNKKELERVEKEIEEENKSLQ